MTDDKQAADEKVIVAFLAAIERAARDEYWKSDGFPTPSEWLRFLWKLDGKRLTHEERRTLACSLAESGMSQLGIAETLKVSPASVSRYLSGKDGNKQRSKKRAPRVSLIPSPPSRSSH